MSGGAADVLRKAAALMRERAETVMRNGDARDLWTAIASMDPDNDGWIVCEQRQPDVDWDTTVARLPFDYEGRIAAHLAFFGHPVVALAVADWLDDTARTACVPEHHKAALAVATAYLGTPSWRLLDRAGNLAPERQAAP